MEEKNKGLNIHNDICTFLIYSIYSLGKPFIRSGDSAGNTDLFQEGIRADRIQF